MSSSVEEGFGTEEEASSGALVEGEAKCSDQRVGGVVVFCTVITNAAITTFGAEAVVSGDCFEQG